MTKLTSFTLIFLIGLTFNNTASAGIFAGVNDFFKGNHHRCSITYSRTHSINNEVKIKKNTTQFTEPRFYEKMDYCAKGVKNLANKIKKWLKKDKNNNVLSFDKSLRCKEGWGKERKWNQVYIPCDDKYNQQLFDLLTDKYPNQIKTEFIKNQTYKDVSSGTTHYNFSKRCAVEYTQLNLATGSRVVDKITTQFENTKYCKEGAKSLAKRIIKWADKTYTNTIVEVGIIKCKIKNYTEIDFNPFTNSIQWGRYANCPEEYKQELTDYMAERRPTKISSRMLKSYYENKAIE